MVTGTKAYLDKSASLVAKQAERYIGVDRVTQLWPTSFRQELWSSYGTDWGMDSWNEG